MEYYNCMSVLSLIYVSCNLHDVKIGTAYERDETTWKLRHWIRPITSHRSQSRYVTAYYIITDKCNWTKIYKKRQVLHMELNILWCRNMDRAERGSGGTLQFFSVVLEKDGEDHLDRSCEKWSVTESQGEKERPTQSNTKEG